MKELIGKKKYQDKSFWLALGLIAILSFIVIIISAEDGTLHLGTAIFPAGAAVSSAEQLSIAEQPAERQHFSFLPQGKTAYLQARQIPGLSVVEFTALENIKDVDVFLSVIPAEEASFHGAVYSAFRIQSVPEAAFSMKLTLRIPREVPVPGLNAGEMQLFADGREIPLILEGSTESYTSYGAQVSGMGTFIIGKAAEESGSAAESAGDGPLALPEPGTETPESAFPAPEDSAIARQPAPGLSFMERIKEFFSSFFSS